MKITELDIRDFGVFQGEKLKDLGDKIIVIGGANRSGKTSLMQVLRNIPFGFSKSKDLPPSKFQYDVRCDLQKEDGVIASVKLKGFSNPEIVYNNQAESNDHNGLYNIDKATYRELFTISLDELNKNTDKEDSNLQSMLLGAGFKHIVKIPSIAKELREKASVIGGTRGNPSTKMFKPYTENIRKSVEERKKSIKQLGTFSLKKNNLVLLESNISSKENELLINSNNIIKLEFLKHNYNINENGEKMLANIKTYFFNDGDIKEYNIEKAKLLKNQYIKELERYKNDSYEFTNDKTKDKFIKMLLVGSKVEIISFYSGISGLKEMCKNLIFVKDEYYEKSGLLMSKIRRANENWVTFDDIAEINCNEVQQTILTQNIEKFRENKDLKTNLDKKIEEYKIQQEILEKQILPYDSAEYIKKYFYFDLFFVIIGLGLFFINKMLGCSLIIIGAIGTVLYLYINHSKSKLIINRNVEIKQQIINTHVNCCKSIEELKGIEKKLKNSYNIMDEYRDILKLDGRVSEYGIKDSYKTVAYLKDEIFDCNLLKKKLSNQFNSLCEPLDSISKVLNKFTYIFAKQLDKISLDNIENRCNDILLKVETLYKYLMLVEKADMSYSKLNTLVEEIQEFLCDNNSEDIMLDIEKYINKGTQYIKYMNQKNELKINQNQLLQGIKSKRIKEIICDMKEELVPIGDVALLKIIHDLYDGYISGDEINCDYDLACAKNKKLILQLDILKNEKQTLKDEIKRLNSDETLVKHEKAIRQARTQLRTLAEKYAIYNTAALLLEKIRERFLENTKDKLLKGASDILSDITSGEYKNIMPPDNLMQGDFRTKLQDDSIKESSEELSRGTKEQLFLAVRMSRIKEIKPSLPVILDDSFVNFDIAHTRNTVKAIVELSKTHQIFVLTCHSTLIELIIALSSKSQYFKLEKGKFTKTLGGDLLKYLKEL
ncbi:AAA family ATPase [Clostridium psychrophilum]|uniref:AAA family ATPase n=1 Tax=Clostridium psychrophilum TaxID=132926 RepID=UPI001C0CB97E|nr:AAA family ATPase [Clostridium psychrophilum]MBU3181532.1 AAA family ATPase [Clostridium psychrophilum]